MEIITVMNKFNNEVTNYHKIKTDTVKQLWTIVTIFDAISEIAFFEIPILEVLYYYYNTSISKILK